MGLYFRSKKYPGYSHQILKIFPLENYDQNENLTTIHGEKKYCVRMKSRQKQWVFEISSRTGLKNSFWKLHEISFLGFHNGFSKSAPGMK